MTEVTLDLPLAGVRVVELTDGRSAMCGRFLADLGAEVILVESPANALARDAGPVHAGQSLTFAVRNANKKSVSPLLDSEGGREAFRRLVHSADILIDAAGADVLVESGLDVADLRHAKPRLVVMTITDFGLTGPYRDYRASNAVLMAMGGVLARSGIKGESPLLPPGELADEASAIQAAWVLLLAYGQSLRLGRGDHLDFSRFEATAQILDPGMGVTGSATAGRSALDITPRGRPPVGTGYPIFRCQDGFVRICLLNPRQWQGMSEWLGPDHRYTDPAYARLGVRLKEIKQINAAIAEHFRPLPVADLVTEGQRRGVPIARVSSPMDVLADPHFAARNAFAPLHLGNGVAGRVPFGYVEIDGVQAGLRTPAPRPGQHDKLLAGLPPAPPATSGWVAAAHADCPRPLQHIRVLDLGVIVAGAELGRLLADQGAEVIKIESSAYVDGLRQALDNAPMTASFAQGTRGKLSFGLNLRSAEGIDLFKRLVVVSDVVLSNFKPGTMDALGLGYETLKAINPDIIVADSSALGSSGPLSRSMGYGPLVRASSGLTWLWRYPGREDGFSDTTTIFPDHFAARISAAAILALLLRRRRNGGGGGRVSVSQAETILATLAPRFLQESLVPGSFVPAGNRGQDDAPSGVFSCAGDDEWCVVSVRGDDAFVRLCQALGRPQLGVDPRFADAAGRLRHADALEQVVAEWTLQRSPREVTAVLQAAGVAAGFMQRLDEYAANPHFAARRFFRQMRQPGLEAPMLTENGPVGRCELLPEPEIRPAPFLGQHTEEIAARLLDLSGAEIVALRERGVLESMAPEARAALAGAVA